MTETWVNKQEVAVINYFKYFNIISSNHRILFGRGGTLILVKRDLKSRYRSDGVDLSAEKDFEASCAEFDSFIILAVYRSPLGNLDIFREKLVECLNKITHNNNKGIILCGDFNVNFPVQSFLKNPLDPVSEVQQIEGIFTNHLRQTLVPQKCML